MWTLWLPNCHQKDVLWTFVDHWVMTSIVQSQMHFSTICNSLTAAWTGFIGIKKLSTLTKLLDSASIGHYFAFSNRERTSQNETETKMYLWVNVCLQRSTNGPQENPRTHVDEGGTQLIQNVSPPTHEWTDFLHLINWWLGSVWDWTLLLWSILPTPKCVTGIGAVANSKIGRDRWDPPHPSILNSHSDPDPRAIQAWRFYIPYGHRSIQQLNRLVRWCKVFSGVFQS